MRLDRQARVLVARGSVDAKPNARTGPHQVSDPADARP